MRSFRSKMVATRRGTRVGSPAGKTEEEAPEPTPTTRRTRSRTVIVTKQSQSEQTTDSQQDEAEVQNSTPAKPATETKRDTRRSIRQPVAANQPDSTHEADVSDSESCCSVASSVLVQSTTRSRRRVVSRDKPAAAATEPEASEGESCTAATSSKPRRSVRSQKKTATVPGKSIASATSKDSDHSEAESCSSVASLPKVRNTRMSTRSQRKTKGAADDAEPSEADSCSSVVSGPLGSTVRRSARSRGTKPVEAIPIHLEESENTEASSPASGPSRPRRRGRNQESKSKSTAEEDNDHASESEGCQSGPSLSPRGKARVFGLDSDSETSAITSVPVGSPCSLRVRLTPCTSQTGSAISNHAVPASRTRSSVRVTCEESTVALDASNKEIMQVESEQYLENINETQKDTESLKDREEDVEEMEEEGDEQETNRTVIKADGLDCSIPGDIAGDLTLTLDEEEDVVTKDTLEPMEAESCPVRGVTVSEETENLEENCGTLEQSEVLEMPESGMENVENFVQEVQSIKGEDLLSAAVVKPEKGVVVTEEPQSNLVDQDQESSDLVEPMVSSVKGVKVVDKPCKKEVEEVIVVEEEEENEDESKMVAKDDAPTVAVQEHGQPEQVNKGVKVVVEEGSEASEAAMVVDVPQKTISVTYSEPADEVEDEEEEEQDHNDKKSPAQVEEHEEPSSSSQDFVQRKDPEETKPKKEVVSLLDSSDDDRDEDEDGGLSDEGCMDEPGKNEEDEVMCLDEIQPGPSREPDSPNNNKNALFVIDARPGLSEKYYIDTGPDEDEDDGHIKESEAAEGEEDFVDEEGVDDDDDDEDSNVLFTTRRPAPTALSSVIDPGVKVKDLGGLYISFDGSKSKSVSSNLKKLKEQKIQDELLKKSVIGSDFEKKEAVPPYRESKRAAKLKRREERDKTTGDDWFNMRAPELTEELKNDLKALQMRSAMDPKRFYKKNDREGFPKYFQVGTVVDNPADFYHSRVPKKERKRTIVDELLADAEFRSYNKRKYKEIMSERAAESAGKMNRKKHKFHKKK